MLENCLINGREINVVNQCYAKSFIAYLIKKNKNFFIDFRRNLD